MSIAVLANTIFSTLTLISQLAILAIWVSILLKKDGWLGLIKTHAILIAFGVALISTLGSLVYSEILGYVPCQLCWYQRILMYPQVVMLGVALFLKGDKKITYINSLILSFLGALLAGYHYLLQIGATEASFCNFDELGLGCSSSFGFNLGYITIPMMALTGFLLIGALQVLKLRENKKQ
ncbi:MAG: disulfide bond formation protein B [Candidatus Colwellbacteria bacterium CG10_big_fil_rev_8_21_14_0_10_42_22]|uniref:Disulfide bond formation protein B n=1 Tax=Candidatus Colwellbacteria bacterium CG10_big_fil_rev_8_21_14_0_10_42_22 TaxID=1974540 RepID=A0A2H0VFW7_9BACT|nr:MAG: disulfide bond formation protein B [Candidatus Colwellbacteria bacterium CG10_big_fil_rev_8_21_14_0_10_42_22]